MAGLAAGFGAVEFVLFAVRLAFFSLGLHKHCLAGNVGTAEHAAIQLTAGAATASRPAQSETPPAVPEKQDQGYVLKPVVERSTPRYWGRSRNLLFRGNV
jgi:hypothetical protein